MDNSLKGGVKKVNVGGLNLAYEEVTPTEPQGSLLLLTGLGANRTAWYGHLNNFGKNYRTVAMDNRDAGDSDLSPEPYTTLDQAKDTAGLITALGLGRTHVVGVSMGGYIAQELALNYPELVRSLVLVCTSTGGSDYVYPTPAAAQALERYTDESYTDYLRRTYPLIVAPGYFERYPQRLEILVAGGNRLPMPLEAYQRQFDTRLTRTTHERASRITAPTLVLHGMDDALTPVENGKHLAAAIPGAKLILYPDCGHLVTMEKSREFFRDTLSFLQEN